MDINDQQAMIDGMDKLYFDPDFRSLLENNTSESIQKFNIHQVADLYFTENL